MEEKQVNQKMRKAVMALARRTVGPERMNLIEAFEFRDMGFGYDRFGFELESGILAFLLLRPVYKKYFRVESEGHEHIPGEGRCIVAPNHSGLLPFDGAMIAIDILEKCASPRIMRAVIDNYTSRLPFVGTAMNRIGQVLGLRRNFEELLRAEEMVAVFPEGAKGPTKLYRHRYRLRSFNMGFIELSLIHRSPIVPVAVVGAEEQTPVLYNAKSLARGLGIPAVPVTPTFPLLGPLGLLPYPTKYHIRYHEPLRYYEEHGPDAARNPELVRSLAEEVREIVQEMVNEGLENRSGVWG